MGDFNRVELSKKWRSKRGNEDETRSISNFIRMIEYKKNDNYYIPDDIIKKIDKDTHQVDKEGNISRLTKSLHTYMTSDEGKKHVEDMDAAMREGRMEEADVGGEARVEDIPEKEVYQKGDAARAMAAAAAGGEQPKGMWKEARERGVYQKGGGEAAVAAGGGAAPVRVEGGALVPTIEITDDIHVPMKLAAQRVKQAPKIIERKANDIVGKFSQKTNDITRLSSVKLNNSANFSEIYARHFGFNK